MTQAGAAIPVVVSTDPPDGGPALRVAVVSDGRVVEAGPARRVVVVTDGRETLGNTPVPVVASAGNGFTLAGPPLVVVVVSGSLGGSPPVNTVLPVVSGATTIGALLSTTDGTWTNSPTGYTYQWKRNGADIVGETNNTYTIVNADNGTTLSVEVTATNASGSASASSAGTAISNPPANTALPVISGTLAIGALLSTTDGTWTNSPTGYTYQWKRNGVNIGGATANTYTLTASDPGTAITVEVTATNAAGSTPATSAAVNPSSLLTSLVAYYKLEEASGTRADSTGRGNNLNTLNGAPGNTTGKVANAIQCTAASAQYAERASTPDLQTGDVDFTVAAWVYIDSKGANRALMGKASSGAIEYSLLFNNAGDRFQFFVSSNGTGFTNNVLANNLGSPSLATWYFVVAWHDATANTINIQVNNGTVDSGAYALGLIAAAGVYRIGSTNVVSWHMDGRVDEAGMWKRTLTAAEKTALYNGGNGTTYPF